MCGEDEMKEFTVREKNTKQNKQPFGCLFHFKDVFL